MNLLTILYSFIYITSDKKRLGDQDCITYTIGEGTGCQFMCDYCAENLGTTNFYFTDWICQNKNGMRSGTPTAWETYTCCTKD